MIKPVSFFSLKKVNVLILIDMILLIDFGNLCFSVILNVFEKMVNDYISHKNNWSCES